MDYLESLLKSSECANLEFKEAKNNYSYEKLLKYCAALANEGGGKLVLGVTDHMPRKVVGSNAFQNLSETVAKLVQILRIKIDSEEIAHPDGRVVVFIVPSRPIGVPLL